MSTFDYPRLQRRDIVEVLADSQIATISEADIVNPNPDFIQNLYARILIHIDCLQEDHGQADFAALQQFDNPDLHVDAVRTINLFHRIRQVMDALDCPKKFTLKDLIKPDNDRTGLFLSAVLNFCLHRETKMALLRPYAEELNLLDEKRRVMEDRIAQLDLEIAEHNISKENEVPLVQELDAKVKEMRQNIQVLNNHQSSLKASIRKTKDKVKEMDEKISSAEFALVQSVQENANLRSKIVQSPDKLQRALEEKKAIRVEVTNGERDAMQAFQEKTARLEDYTKACKKMSKHFAQMQAIQEQVNSLKSTDKDIKILKGKLSDEAVLEKSLEVKIVERQGKVDHLDELLKQLQKESDLSCEAAAKELKNVKLEVEAMRSSLQSRRRNVEAVLAEADATTAEISKVKESGAAKQKEICRKCEEIEREFHQYSNAIGNLLKLEMELKKGQI